MTDWHRADIVARLKKAGWPVRALSIEANLAPNTLGKALDAPYLPLSTFQTVSSSTS